MKKIILIITSVILALVLIVAIALVGNTFFYYPHYKENKQEANIKIENTEQIKMMSYNLRCISPTDFGKKAWFYRADLVIDDIESSGGIETRLESFVDIISSKWYNKCVIYITRKDFYG